MAFWRHLSGVANYTQTTFKLHSNYTQTTLDAKKWRSDAICRGVWKGVQTTLKTTLTTLQNSLQKKLG